LNKLFYIYNSYEIIYSTVYINSTYETCIAVTHIIATITYFSLRIIDINSIIIDID